MKIDKKKKTGQFSGHLIMAFFNNVMEEDKEK